MALDIDMSLFDAFGRVRVSTPSTIFDSKQLYDNQALIWDDQQVSGSGTTSVHNPDLAASIMSVGNLVAGRRVRQTRGWFRYQPAKSQLIFMTGVLGEARPGIVSRFGQYNDKNGIFLQMREEGPSFAIRSHVSGAPVDLVVNRADWSIDKFDGRGPSGIRLDFSKAQIFTFDYEWLGAGSVLLGFVVNRKAYPAHRADHANLLENVYMSSPNLPLRYEIENDGTGAASSLVHICSSIISEGGVFDTGTVRGFNRAGNILTVSDANLNIIQAFRKKATHLGAHLSLVDFRLFCSSTAIYAWHWILNPTLSGTAISWVPAANSSIEYAFPTGATCVPGTGTLQYTGVVSDTSSNEKGAAPGIRDDASVGSSIAGVSDIYVLAIERLSGGNETFYSSMVLKESV